MSQRYERAKQLTEKYASKLSHCRICHQPAHFSIEPTIFRTKNNTHTYQYWINCPTPNCDCVCAYTIKEAIEKWNIAQNSAKRGI